MFKMLRKVPLIVILGSTGTGKTKLSIELAQRFGGEIISADSMQVYANLDIATAKATKTEQAAVKHHLLDVVRTSEPYTVVHFRNAALPIVEDLLSLSKCPIVVGGTNYYIESLLWDILVTASSSNVKAGDKRKSTDAIYGDSRTSGDDVGVDSSSSSSLSSSDSKGNHQQHQQLPEAAEMSSMASEILHSHLRKIDPLTADRMHPNNKRKIIRAIEVFQQTGKQLSTILKEQRERPGGNRLGGPLRYPHTILLWLRCNQDVLNGRLDKRVDAMLEQGLLQEIRNFYNEHIRDSSSKECTKGVLQTIGFKEFVPYLEKYGADNDRIIDNYLKANSYRLTPSETYNHDATDDINKRPQGMDLLQDCLNELKLVTRRYSKKQIKWIENRFLARKDRQVPDIYQLDSSNVQQWNKEVLSRAVNIIDCYRDGQVSEIKPMKKIQHPGAGLDEEISNFCPTCQRHFIGEFQWQLHLKSNKHKRRKDGIAKREKLSKVLSTSPSASGEQVKEVNQTKDVVGPNCDK